MSALHGGGPGEERAWFEPGLLRRVEEHRAAKPPKPEPRPPWWRRLGRPSTRWTAEGTFMLFVAAACITLGDVVAMTVTHHGGVASITPAASQSQGQSQAPAPVRHCIAVPIPYSALPRC
jgi:hypothetical protein